MRGGVGRWKDMSNLKVPQKNTPSKSACLIIRAISCMWSVIYLNSTGLPF